MSNIYICLLGAEEDLTIVKWVKPELVVQVSFVEWPEDGLLRHPTFLGIREDKAAREVGREPKGGLAKKDIQPNLCG